MPVEIGLVDSGSVVGDGDVEPVPATFGRNRDPARSGVADAPGVTGQSEKDFELRRMGTRLVWRTRRQTSRPSAT